MANLLKRPMRVPKEPKRRMPVRPVRSDLRRTVKGKELAAMTKVLRNRSLKRQYKALKQRDPDGGGYLRGAIRRSNLLLAKDR